ncbi:Bug family tripartite tricarboxylate transporter substrate binding protein [Bordetella genomosp. 11]|uniref:LacI family transcriptional regulator n=1 Tax=Bordetella genomosp. 11 TaxID=1416808 RepID=A0A261UKJ0_9BORD|nr:tripartite tricarboxylate transporter substrate binding protein [Bordetella genomosp. 11]OZI62047.1 LacI family transcriptional regulator [Bordetella genomosp. 11]
MTRLFRALKPAALLCGLLAILPTAQADYPDRPITITVPTAPGGTVDIVARILAAQLGDELKQSIIVSNKAGAGGVVGTQAAKRERPDGYNLLFTANSNQLIVPWIYAKPGFDPLRDFVPIAAVGVVPNVLLVNPTFPARNLQEFIAEVKAHPGQYRYASAGTGTLNHLLGAMLNEKGGLELEHVPYRGVAPAMTDVLGNQVPMLFASLPSALEAVKAGQLRAIGVSSASRVPLLPDVPAIAEAVPGFSGDLWVAFYAPAGTPKDVVAKLYQGIKTALASPAVQQRFQQLGVTELHDGPDELARRQASELEQWRDIVKASGARAD